MIHRRGVIPILLLLALVVLGVVLQIVRGAAPSPTAAAASPPAAATPSPADSATARAVVATVARVERAFNAGDVRLLCRPGALVDGAVIRSLDGHAGGCERQLETLVADEAPLRLTVRKVSLRPDLATVVVTPRRGTTAPVDLVRGPRGWLLSFSGGDDPMPALAGTT